MKARTKHSYSRERKNESSPRWYCVEWEKIHRKMSSTLLRNNIGIDEMRRTRWSGTVAQKRKSRKKDVREIEDDNDDDNDDGEKLTQKIKSCSLFATHICHVIFSIDVVPDVGRISLHIQYRQWAPLFRAARGKLYKRLNEERCNDIKRTNIEHTHTQEIRKTIEKFIGKYVNLPDLFHFVIRNKKCMKCSWNSFV